MSGVEDAFPRARRRLKAQGALIAALRGLCSHFVAFRQGMLGLKSLLPTNGFSPFNHSKLKPFSRAESNRGQLGEKLQEATGGALGAWGGELGGGSVVGRLIPRALGFVPRVFFSLKGNPSKPF